VQQCALGELAGLVEIELAAGAAGQQQHGLDFLAPERLLAAVALGDCRFNEFWFHAFSFTVCSWRGQNNY